MLNLTSVSIYFGVCVLCRRYSDDDLDRYFEAQKQMLELGLQRALLEEHGDSVDRQVLDQACHELVDRTFREVETARADEIDPRTNRYMKRAEDLSKQSFLFLGSYHNWCSGD